jgi:hypothetical protein
MPPPAYRIASFSLQSRVAPRMIASPPRSVPLRHAIIPPIHRTIATDQHRSPRERDRVTSAATVRIRLFFFRCSAAVALVEYILVGVAARFNELGGG